MHQAVTRRKRLHPRANRGKRGGLLFCVAVGAETLRSLHLATELAQPEHAFQMDPEVHADFGCNHEQFLPDTAGEPMLGGTLMAAFKGFRVVAKKVVSTEKVKLGIQLPPNKTLLRSDWRALSNA